MTSSNEEKKGIEVSVETSPLKVEVESLKLKMPTIELVQAPAGGKVERAEKGDRGESGRDGQNGREGKDGKDGCGRDGRDAPLWAIVLAIVVAIAGLGLALYLLGSASKPALTPINVPTYEKYEYKGDGLFDKVGAFLWIIVGGTAVAEEKLVDENHLKLVKKDYEKKSTELKTFQGQKEQAEKDLATANISVAKLQAELDSAKKSGSGQAASLRSQLEQAKIVLQYKEDTLKKLEGQVKQLEADLKKADVEKGAQDTTLKIVQAQFGAKEKSNLAEPDKDGVPKACDGELISATAGWGYTYFKCSPKQEKSLTEPAKPDKGLSKYVKCLVWAGVGGAGGSAGNYGYGRAIDRKVNAKDWIIGGLAGGAIGYGVCVLFPSDD